MNPKTSSWNIGVEVAVEELIEAAELVMAGLYARIDAAPGSAKPVFNGIADLHDAVAKVRVLAPSPAEREG